MGWVEALDELKEFSPAALEEQLRQTLKGPDARWTANHHRAKQQRAPLPDSTPELAKSKEVLRAIDTDPKLKHIHEASGLLGCYLRNRVRAAIEADE